MTTFVYESADGAQLHFVIPVGAVTEPVELVFIDGATVGDVPSTLHFAERVFAVVAYRNGEPVSPFQFTVPITVTLTYRDEELAGTDEAKLALYYWDGTAAQWLTDGITMIAHDLVNNQLVVTIAHLTTFALFTSSSTAAPTATPTATPTLLLTPVPTPTSPVMQNDESIYLPLIQRRGFKLDRADQPIMYCYEDRCIMAEN